MWEIILSVPILVIAMLLQIGIFGNVHIMKGSADLMMLIVIAWGLNDLTEYSWIWAIVAGLLMSYASALPLNGYLLLYVILWLLIRLIRQRIWKMPVFLMILLCIIGTLLESAYTLGILTFQQAAVDYPDALRQIIVPSIVMNLILTIPVYASMNDIANTICPEGEEV